MAALADEPIVVASKNFPESRLLGELMAQVIERDTDLTVERRLNLGYSTIVFESLKAGDIDLYAEYTGTAWQEYLKIGRKVNDPLEAYVTVANRMADELGLVWLEPFGFQNSFALAMSERRADELGVLRISDLVEHGSTLRVGVSADFFQRNDGYQPLAEEYGLRAASVRTLDHGLVYQALDSGEVDLVDVWTTDGKLARYNLRVLQDDRGFFPPYHAAPVIRAAVSSAIRRWPPR